MSSRLRQYILDEARDRVLRLAKLRPPQREAFDKIHSLISGLDQDLATYSADDFIEHLRRAGLEIPAPPPQLIFALATGVGKTRLMGAIITYLHNARQSNNFLILAPRAAVLEKLERETQSSHPKYLFIDPSLLPDPTFCFRDNVESFRPSTDHPNIFVLSPQSITGKERRFSRESEFRGYSLVEYLRSLSDLVIFVDEAHHVGPAAGEDTAAWMKAVTDLQPRLYFGLTATPRTDPGVNIISSYDLATCLREGRYTKAVDLIVEQRDENVSEEDWDRYTIDFALSRLDRKRKAIQEYASRISAFPAIEPVLLVCAKDTGHAEEIARWLQDARGISQNEILITHSERKLTEADISRLVAIDQPANQIRIVVNVFQLTEGWDVTNVYVIAPLRAMAAFRSAVQTMGRGLRLPAGHRIGHLELDTLDVLCCGRESFHDILDEATKHFGTGDDGIGLNIKPRLELEKEQPLPTKQVIIPARQHLVISVPVVKRLRAEPNLDFEIQNLGRLMQGGATALHLATLERTGLDEGILYTYEDFVASIYARVLLELDYLSDPLHGEALEKLVRSFIDSLGAHPDRPISSDPVRFALLIADEIDKRYRQLHVKFEISGFDDLTLDDYAWRVPESYSEPVDRILPGEWQ
jgi:superfamily II DNA or RNA helicase